MSEPERIPHFITPSLPHLSGLMTYYAEDLTICEGLLKLFRDYAEQYISMLTREQCIELFATSAKLLKHYSEHHCKNRVVSKRSEAIEEEFEEEQQYNDVMSAIQLLIHLGTKDFTNLCNTASHSSKGVDTSQITACEYSLALFALYTQQNHSYFTTRKDWISLTKVLKSFLNCTLTILPSRPSTATLASISG